MPHRHDALTRLMALTNRPMADVCLATPHRFLGPRKLSRPNEAIDGMLEVLIRMAAITNERDVSCALVTSGRKLSQPPKLYLSHHTVDGAFYKTLRNSGTDVWHFKAADLPGRTAFDPMGFSGWSSLASMTAADLPLDQIPLSDATATLKTFRNAAIDGNLSKYAQADGHVPAGDFVFVALQTIGDMVQRKAYMPMLHMLDLVVARFAGTPIKVVVKRHPRCRSSAVSKALAKLSAHPGVTISTASIHALMANARALFTVNSGVGSEAMIHRLPVYAFGASDYAATAHQIRDADTLGRLTTPLHHRLDPDTLARFHFYYRNTYQVTRDTGLQDRLNNLLDAATLKR